MKVTFSKLAIGGLLFISSMNINAQEITKEVYKKTPTRDLTLKIYSPANLGKDVKRPAIVFFFGGGWNGRSIKQFERHSEVLSKKGMVCFIADYRVKSTDKVTPDKCLMDAKSAMRYVYANADRFHVDTTMIAASGGSAGGHLAAATCYCKGFDDPKDNVSINCKPKALVLFNPVVDNSKEGYGYDRVKNIFPQFSPLENINNPVPTVFFVGSEDKLITPKLAKKYQQRCEAAGGRCDLHIFEGKEHGFFNKDEDYKTTMDMTVDFLKSIGYVE